MKAKNVEKFLQLTKQRMWRYEKNITTDGYIILKDADEPHTARLYFGKLSTELSQGELEFLTKEEQQ